MDNGVLCLLPPVSWLSIAYILMRERLSPDLQRLSSLCLSPFRKFTSYLSSFAVSVTLREITNGDR